MNPDGITLDAEDRFKDSEDLPSTVSIRSSVPSLSPNQSQDLIAQELLSSTMVSPESGERVCEVCGNPLTKRQKRFCSQRCHGKWKIGENNPQFKSELHGRICEVCEGTLTSKQQRFCSKKCTKIGMTGKGNPSFRPELHEETCEQCGGLRPRQCKRFCSRKCQRAWYNSKKEIRTCDMCGKTLTYHQKRFCSREHYAIWLSQNLCGPNSPGWKGGGKVTLNCHACGKEIEKWECEARLVKHHYCDWKCKIYTERFETHCGYCGNSLELPIYRIERVNNNFCNTGCEGLWRSENIRGSNSPSWRGGISFYPHALSFTERLKETIRERDGRTCQYCGVPESEINRKLSIHHINYGKESADDVEDNLISLCISCHSMTNAHRWYWEAYFKMKIQEKTNMQSRLHLVVERDS